MHGIFGGLLGSRVILLADIGQGAVYSGARRPAMYNHISGSQG